MAKQEQKNEANSAEDARTEWHELDFDKISAQDAENNPAFNAGGDGMLYS